MRYLLLLGASALLGHDMWIEPATFRPDPGQVVAVKLRVGQDLLGDPIPRSAHLIRDFVIADGVGRQNVAGREGSDPAGFVRVANAGVSVIGYNSNASAVELEAEKFNAYLKEEGLDAVLAARVRRKESGKKVREQFSRCAKSLLSAGAGQGDRILGFPLELLAEQNPYSLKPGEALPVRLVYGNRPLAGALVVAINRLRPAEKVTARTDREGRVKLLLNRDGMWMVKAVHMTAAQAGAEADWSSYWASLTFAMGSK